MRRDSADGAESRQPRLRGFPRRGRRRREAAQAAAEVGHAVDRRRPCQWDGAAAMAGDDDVQEEELEHQERNAERPPNGGAYSEVATICRGDVRSFQVGLIRPGPRRFVNSWCCPAGCSRQLPHRQRKGDLLSGGRGQPTELLPRFLTQRSNFRTSSFRHRHLSSSSMPGRGAKLEFPPIALSHTLGFRPKTQATQVHQVKQVSQVNFTGVFSLPTDHCQLPTDHRPQTTDH